MSPPTNNICIERRLFLFQKILDGRARGGYLSAKYGTRSQLSYRLPIPRTNST